MFYKLEVYEDEKLEKLLQTSIGVIDNLIIQRRENRSVFSNDRFIELTGAEFYYEVVPAIRKVEINNNSQLTRFQKIRK